MPTVEELAPLLSASQVAGVASALVQLDHTDKKVFKALAACATERAPEFRARQLSDTAWAFGQRLDGSQPLFEALSVRAQALVGSLEARHITDLAVAFSQARIRNQPLFEALCLQGTKRLATFEDRTDLLQTARALPMLAAKNSQSSESNASARAFFTALASRVQERITDFRAQHVAAANEAFAKLLAADAPLFQTLREHSLKIIDQATRRDLVLLARAFPKNSPNSAELLRAVRVRAEAHLAFQGNHLIETVECFAGLQQTPPPLIDALNRHLPTRTLTELRELTRFFEKKLKKDPPLAKAIRKSVAQRLGSQDLGPGELAVAATFAIDDQYKGACSRADLRALALRELPGCTTCDLADLAKPFALLFREDEQLFETIEATARKKIEDFSPRDIAHLCRGFQTAGYRNEGFFHKVAAEVIKKISILNAKDIAQIAYSFAFLNMKHGPMLEALALRLFQGANSPNAVWERECNSVALFAWSAAVLQPSIVKQHYKPEDLDRRNLDDAAWRQLFQALHASGALAANVSHPRYDAVVKAELEENANRTDRFTLRFKAVLLKLLEKALTKTDKRPRYDLKMHTIIAGAAVDLELHIGGRKIIFECDGAKYHKSRGPQRRVLGKDIIQERSAHRLNYEVIHVCSEQWNNRQSRHQLLKELKSRIENRQGRNPGE